MVLEEQRLPFLTWLIGYPFTDAAAVLNSALVIFFFTAFALSVLALIVGFLIAVVRHGPLAAGDITYRVVVNGISELLHTSPRRVWAIARLAIKESIRRRVFIALAVYFVVLLCAGWFLKTNYPEPGKLFFSFVLTASTWIVLLSATLISAFSLPNDFKTKTIYTVVTKPVRSGDIVLGRILGFTIIGSILLAVMSVFSAVFVWRTLDHTHTINVASLENEYDTDGKEIGKTGQTNTSQFHFHEIEIYPDGTGHALSTNEHEHIITSEQRGGETVYTVSHPHGMFRARNPHYGKLSFLDRTGVPSAKGISVGAEWTYRSFIEGGTPAAAVWTFDGIDKSKLRDVDGVMGLPIELIVRVFRTYQGNIDAGIQGSVQLVNPDSKGQVKSYPEIFTAKDNSVNSFHWPTTLPDANRKDISLLDDLVTDDGRLQVVVQCLDRAQYFGFAQPDCYVRLNESWPLWNLIKAYISIWGQMVLVIAIGVACSTLVNTPVAILFSWSYLALGFFRRFFLAVALGTQIGGGPLESLYRLVTQMNQMSPLPENFGTAMLVNIDTYLFKPAMLSLTYILPNLQSLNTVDYVKYGFSIPMNHLVQASLTCLVYVAGAFVIGYFFLRTREVAK
jgi:hypothetical protein